jgi:hypothetical protein
MQLTRSLKAPPGDPTREPMKYFPGFKICFQNQLVPLHLGAREVLWAVHTLTEENMLVGLALPGVRLV